MAAKVTFKGETHDVQSLKSWTSAEAMTTDHSTITCSCRMGQKGDLCGPKITAMMKLQKLSALKALGMKLADDEHAEVTTGNTGTNQSWDRSIPEVHNHDERSRPRMFLPQSNGN